MTKPVRKAARLSTAAPARVLPKAVLSTLLEFLVADEIVRDGPLPVPWGPLEALRALFPSDTATVDALTAEYQRSELTIDFQSLDEVELQRIYDAVRAGSTTTRSLRIRAGVGNREKVFPAFVDIASLDAFAVDWPRIFTACPHLRRLDLSDWPLQSAQLFNLLNTASQHCKLVDQLVMSKYVRNLGPVDKSLRHTSDLRPVTEMVMTALRRWREHGRGLRRLCLPQRMLNCDALGLDVVALTDDFLRAVSRYCPDLEYLDGYRPTFNIDNRLFCDEFLCCSPEVWREFCNSCTKLRELNWFAVPYLDAFFEAFGEVPKPLLTSLVVAGGGDRFEYPTERDVYGDDHWFSEEGTAKLFEGCPALKHLQVYFLYHGYETEGERQDEWTDDVLFAIATHCPLLETFEMIEIDAGAHDDMTPMMNITEGGVEALARLPYLVKVHLKPTYCHAEGIFALMEHAPQRGDPRKAIIELMNTPHSEVAAEDWRCDTLLGLLWMVSARGDALHTRRFDVELVNIQPDRELQKPAVFTAQCLDLIRQIRAKHPTVAIQLTHTHEGGGDPALVDMDTHGDDEELTRVHTLRIVTACTEDP